MAPVVIRALDCEGFRLGLTEAFMSDEGSSKEAADAGFSGELRQANRSRRPS